MAEAPREPGVVVLQPRRTRVPVGVDVGLGLLVVGARVALTPARLLARRPGFRSGERQLAATGRDVAERGRRVLEAAVEDAAASPAVARAVDAVLAGPLPEDLARSLVDHRVVERVVATPEVQRAVADALAREGVADRVVESPEFERLLAHVVASPAVRSGLTQQTTSFAGELAAGVRARAAAADDAVARAPAAAGTYAGLVIRALAFVLDLAIVSAAVVAGGAALGLVASLVGELRPEWLVALLLGSAWVLAANAYFLLFWTVVGSTPGMHALRLRVVDPYGRPPGFGRSVLRLAGLALAIVPLFAGFLPMLFDARRRGLHDLLARTVVVFDA